DIERVSDGLRLRLHPVKAFSFKAALAFSREFPFHIAGLCLQRIELSVITAEVNSAINNRGSAWHWTSCRCLPELAPGFGIYGAEISVLTAAVDRVFVSDWGANHSGTGNEFPFDPMKLAWSSTRINAGVRCIASKHCLST